MTTASASTASLPIDDVDPAVLSDLLDFLDDFDQATQASSPGPTTVKSAAAPDSPQSPSTGAMAAGSGNGPSGRSTATKKTRPRRVERYWIKKHELQALREETAFLANKLELLRQCARSPAEVRVTSELGVSIRRIVHSHWRQLAAHEKARREKAERQNAQLRALTQYQKQWNSGLQSELNQLAAMAMEVSSATKTTTAEVVVTRQKRASWREILVELFREACALANVRPETALEKFDWTNMYSHFIYSKPMLEWTTTFPVPEADPIRVGDTLWTQTAVYSAIHHMKAISGVIERPNVTPPRLHRDCGFAYSDKNGRPLSSKMISVFEMHRFEGTWISTATCSVFDIQTSALLITTTATTIVTKVTANPESCIVRAQYRVHDSDDLLVLDDSSQAKGNAEIKQLAAHAKVVANNWAMTIRKKDYDIQKMLLHGSE